MLTASSRSGRFTRRIAVLATGVACASVLAATGVANATEANEAVTAVPMTATGCTGGGFPYQNVCIRVDGASVHVTKVSIGNNTGTSGDGWITVNGSRKWDLGAIKGHWMVGLQVHADLPDGAEVCAHIAGVDGVPCETIEK